MVDIYAQGFGGGGGDDTAPAPPPTPTPAPAAPHVDIYSQGFGGGGEPSPASQKAVGDDAWSDYAHSAAHDLYGTRAGLLSFMAGTASDPETQQRHEIEAENARSQQQASLDAMTPAGRESATAPVFSSQTWQHPGRALAFGAESLATGMAPYAVAGAVGGLPGVVAYGAAQGAGDVRNNVTDAIMNAPESKLMGADPDYAMIRQRLPDRDARMWLRDKVLSSTDATWWGAGAGALMAGAGGELMGGPLTKMGVGAAEHLALTGTLPGAARGATELGVSSAIQYGATQHAGAQAGANEEPTAGEIVGAGVVPAVGGAAFGAGAARWHRPPVGGENVANRSSRDSGKQAKEQATAAEEAAKAGAAAPPSGAREPDKIITPDIAAAAKGEPIVTPGSNQQAEAVKQPAPVVQPTGVGAAEATGAPPAGITPVAPSPPTEAAEAAAAPAAAPANAPAPEVVAPEPPSTIVAQHQALLDPNDPRVAVLYNPGQQPIEITEKKGSYGQMELPDGTGRIIQYYRGRGGLSREKITAAVKNNDLNSILQYGPVNKDEAVARSVAGEEPAVVATTTDTGVPVKEAAGTTATAPAQAAAQEATKGPGDTVGVKSPLDMIAARKAELDAAERGEFAPGVRETLGVTPESKPQTIGEQLAARNAERATQAQAAAQTFAAERAARMEALKREMNEKLATAPGPGDRVLRAEDAGEKAMQAAQAAAQDRVQGVTTATAEEPKPKGKNWTKGELTKKENANQAANEIMQAERNHPKPGEQPNDILARAKGIVAEAKGIHVPTEISEEGKHGPGMMLLREAKDLIAKDLPKQDKFPSMADYARFTDREGMIRRGELDKALEARRNEGKEASALGAPAEVKAEGVRPGEGGEHLAEVSPEEEVIHREEAEEQAKEQEKEVAGEPRKLTENERRAQEASERARARLEAQEAPRERPTVTRESDEEPAVRGFKQAVGFKVEKTRPRIKRGDERDTLGDEHDTLPDEEKGDWRTGDDSAPAEGYLRYRTGPEKRDYVDLKKARPSTTIGAAIHQHLNLNKYAPWLAKMIERLRDAVVQVAGDTPVHYVSHDELQLKLDHSFRGVYRAKESEPYIILNPDKMTHDTALHEGFHAATLTGIVNNPKLMASLRTMRDQMEKYVRENPELHIGRDQDTLVRLRAALKDQRGVEMMTYLMTNEGVQDFFKAAKISEALAKDLGVAGWLKKTMWEGAISLMRRGINSAVGREVIGPRDTPAIKAMMAATEEAMWSDPKNVGMTLEAAARYNKNMLREKFGDMADVLSKAEEKTPADASRSRARYSETMDKITDAVKERIKDVPPGVHTVTEKMRALIDTPRDWMERAKERGWRIASTAERIIDHMGELGADREKILKLSTPVMDRLGRLYSENGNEFSKLARLFVSSTIHGADARDDLGKGLNEHIRVNKKNIENSNLEHWDAIKGNPKDREDYKAMSPDTQALYNDTMDELKKMNLRVIDATRKSLGEKLKSEMGASIPQERRDAVQKVIDRKELTPDELKEHGDDPNIRALQSYDAMAKRATLGAYFPLKRTEGTHYVGGEHEYELPQGVTRASNDENDPDYHRIVFNDRKAAHDFDPDLPTTPSIQHYIQDASGKREYVSADEATSTPGAKHGQEYHVLVNNRDVRFVNGNVEGARVKREMEKEGMKNVSVQPRKNQEVWQYGVNSSHVTAIMKRLNKMDMTDAERAGLGDAIKHVAASSMPGSRLSRGFLHRDRTGGAGGDIIATLDMHRRTSAGLQAMAGHRNEIDASLEKMKQYVDDHPNHKDVGDMRQMVNMYDDRINNFQKDALSDINVNKNWNAIRAYTTLNDLVSPAFFLLHQLHIPLTVFPHLAAEHGIGLATRVTLGVYRDMLGTELPTAFKAMGRAVTKAWRYNHQPTDFIDALKNEGKLSADERSMIDWGVAHDFAHSTGIDFSQAYVSQRALDKFASKARNFSQEFIGSADAFNKVNSALMFYRAAIEKGIKGEDAYRHAWDNVAKTQGQYTSFQRMGMFRNARMQTLLQYKQYPILMAKMIAKAMYNSFAPGVEWETRARALRTFGLMTLSAGTMSGVQGGTAYPIRLADDLLHLLGITDGWETHMDELRRSLASSMGPTGATALMDGLGGLAGIYAGHRGGISDPLGINYLLETSKGDQDMYKYLAGPPGGLAHNLITGMGGLLQGDPDTAIKNLLPRVATDPIKAYEEYNHGVSTQRGAIISPPVSGLEAVYKALGLTTIVETHAREARAAVGRERTEQQDARGKITKLWQSGDRAGAIAAVHKFNMAYPSQHITVASLSKLGGRPTVLGYPETPKNRAELEERAHAYGLQ